MKPDMGNWRWRVNHLYKINDKNGRLITLKENWIQKRISDSRRRRKMILKYRQGGVTTGEIIKQLDFCAFSQNKTAVIMADQQGNMEKIFSKVRLAHKSMPRSVRPNLSKGGGSAYELKFDELNSKIYCALEGRGDTIHWLHISEAAFADPKRVKATLEAVPIDGIVTFESTPNGMGNNFYKRWITPSKIMDKMFFPWFMHPEYRLNGSHIKEFTSEEQEFIEKVHERHGYEITKDHIAFRRAKQEDQQELFIQEYPEDDISCFLASGEAAMDQVLIKKLMDNLEDPISDDGTLKIFKPYDPSQIYVLGCDTAEGRGGDNSVISVMEVRSREQVAEYASNTVKPRLFAHKIQEVALMYWKPGRPHPLVGVERNNHGHAVLLELDEHLHYPNIYCYKTEDRGGERVPGWKTDSVTRPLMVDTFIDGAENETIILNSAELLGECLTLIDNKGKIEASEGENDDRVIATSIATQMCIVSSKESLVWDDLQNAILM